MQNIAYRTDKDLLYIELVGRIDASNAAEIEDSVKKIRSDNPGMHTVFDADKLEYISSAGLRILLRVRKEEPGLAIINASPEVYGILEMTGFTEMLTVEKTYPKISIDGCEFIAKGANGAVYRYDDETIVKHYFNRDALPEIKQERENARKAFVLGVNTAIPYGIVRIGDGYGSVTELLNATSITKIIRANPEDMEQAVAYFVDTAKLIHSIEVEKGELPDYREWVITWVEFLKDYLPDEYYRKLSSLISTLPESRYLIHGDYHTNNVMIQNGEALLIDLDTLASGCPILELGSMYNAFVGFSEKDHSVIKDFLGIDFETAGKFWKLSLMSYLGTDNKAVIEDVENKAKVIGYTRLLRRSIRRSLGEETIEYYKENLIDTLNKVDNLDF